MNKKTLAKIVGFICVAITLFSIISVRNTDFYKIPLFEMVLKESQVDEMEEALDKLEEAIDDATDEEIEELEDESGMTIKEYKKLIENPSLARVAKMGKKVDQFNDSVEIVNTFNIVITIYGVIIMLMSLLAALGRSRALSIISIVVSLPFYIFLAGIVWLILFVVATIAHVVFLTKEKEVPPVAPVM